MLDIRTWCLSDPRRHDVFSVTAASLSSLGAVGNRFLRALRIEAPERRKPDIPGLDCVFIPTSAAVSYNYALKTDRSASC